MNTTCLFVNIKESRYPIYIGTDLLKDKTLLYQYVKGHQIMIVTNKTIAPFYLESLKIIFYDFQCDQFLLPDGEQFKDIRHWQKILNKLITSNHHRDTTLIALGGGIVGDLTGFVAACYQRGVDFIQLPTTLLAQVDASIGGKTAVNHPYGKNLIGAFYQPKVVISDLNTLNTLPQREFNAGISEIIKVALIYDKEFFIDLEKNITSLLKRDLNYLQTTIKRACEIKRDIVNADEKEKTGQRALLNLGHTFGHAIEQLLGYGYWLHGEAVAVGLVLAAELSCYLGLISSYEVNRIRELLQKVPLPTQLPKEIDQDSLLIAMYRDKKVINKHLHLVLLERIGRAIISD
ncbi:MAG: 3-dehydroquinate synthase [Coxiella endosymbiont of Dermacentor nuttalli]